MNDCREKFLSEIKHKLLTADCPIGDVKTVMDTITSTLAHYQISNPDTAIVTYDHANENLLKIYAGTLLTEGKSPKTVYGYTRLLMRFAQSVGKPLLQINVFDIRIWLAQMQQQVSLRSCENYKSYITAFYNWATQEEMIPSNPASKIKPIKFEHIVRLPFSAIELDALRSNCTTLRERAELELLISSGIRVSELCAMNIDDIDLNNLVVLVRNGKGNKQRTTYTNSVCAKYLHAYLESRTDDDPCLFRTKAKRRLSKGAAEEDLARIATRAGVNNAHPHRCRRTFATELARKGMDIRTIQQLMGHTNINTTMSYITISMEHTHNEYRRFA